jgi:hypothetical protein
LSSPLENNLSLSIVILPSVTALCSHLSFLTSVPLHQRPYLANVWIPHTNHCSAAQ